MSHEPLYPHPFRDGALHRVGGGWRYVVIPALLSAVLGVSAGFDVLLSFVLVTLGIGGTISLLEWLVVPHLPPVRGFGRGALLLCEIAIAVLVGGELALQAMRLLAGWDPGEARRAVFTIGAWVTLGVVAFDGLRARAERSRLEAEEARRAAVTAKLDALRATMQPHFLFNALNSVAQLIAEDPARAEAAVEKLSAVLRHSLSAAKTDEVPLAEELQAVRAYLAVEELRLGPRLRHAIEATPEAERALVPPLSVQPLVENAVLHAIAPRREGGLLLVEATVAQGKLHLRVSDDGPGTSDRSGTGTGLSALRERLRLKHGDAARVNAGPGDRGFVVELELPCAS